MIGSGSLLGLSDSSLTAGPSFRLLGSDQSGCGPSRLLSSPVAPGDEDCYPTDSRRSIGLLLGSIPGHGGQIRGLDPVALELGEVVVAGQPRNVSPQVDRVLVRRQLADHGPEDGRPGTAVEDDRRYSEAARPLDQCVVLVEDGLPGPGSESASSHHSTSRPTSSSAPRTAVAISCSGGDCSQILLPSAV